MTNHGTTRRGFLSLCGAAAAAGLASGYAPALVSAEVPPSDPRAVAAREIQALRNQRHSCSQATFVGLCRAFASAIPEQQLLALSSGFAGGIGKTFGEGTCGALVGGVMALGLFLPGRTESSVTRSKDLFERFTKKEGTVVCKDILQKYGGFANCTNCCLFAGDATADMLLNKA